MMLGWKRNDGWKRKAIGLAMAVLTGCLLVSVMEAQQGGRIERERVGQREGRGRFPELMERFGQRFPSDPSFFPPNSRQRLSGLGLRSRQQSQNVELVGFTGGAINDVFVKNNYAYCASGSGLLIFDVSNPSNPQLVGKLLLPDFALGVYVSGNYAYVADRYAGLRVIDVSNPSNPREVGYFDTPGDAWGVYVSGNYAYVADGGAGLRVIDVSNPSNPREVGYFDTPGEARGVYVSGNYAYVADGSGLRVIDVSNPTNPREVGFFDTPGDAWGVYVSGNYAYVADRYAGLRVIDVSNPSNPREVGFFDTPGEARGVYVSGNYAYVADGGAGLRVIDVSNPANPREVGFFDTPDYAWGVYVSGNYAYVADGLSGLRVIDVSNPSNPREVGYFNTLGAKGVYVSGNYAYVADGLSGLRVIDVSNPSNPREVGYFDTPGYAWGVYVSGNYAYVADGLSGLRVIDVSNPSNPREVGFFDTPGDAEDVYVSGNYAYVADWRAGLRVIDVSNPSNPREVGYFNTLGAQGVYVSGNYAYVADDFSGLGVIDVSNPSNPREVGYFNTPRAQGVYVSGNYAYVAVYFSGLKVIDVSNPSNPREVGFFDTPGEARGVYVSGNYAYVADGLSGLRVIDVSNPANPREVGFFDTPDYAWGVYVSGNYAYVADGAGGLFILRFTGAQPVNRPPSVPVLLSPANNATVSPTPTFKVKSDDPDGDQVKFEIEVVKGSETKRFETGFFASGSEATFTVPENQSLSEGQWSWRARAIDNKGAASDWSSALTFTVQVQVAKPDLAITDIRLSRDVNESRTKANWLQLEASVKNLGSVETNNFKVKFWAINPEGKEIEIGTVQGGKLSSGGELKFFIDWQLPQRVMEGWKVKAEVVESVPEDINRDNNFRITERFNVYYVSDGANNIPWDMMVDAYSFANPPKSFSDLWEDVIDIVTSIFNIAPPTEKIWLVNGEGRAVSRISPILGSILIFGAWVVIGYFQDISGHCYGMASTSILYKENNNFKPPSVRDKSTYEMSWDNSEVKLYINAYHRSQMVSILANSWLMKEMNAENEANYLRQKINKENKPVMLLIWGKRGHAVTAIGVVEYPELKKMDIHIYDNEVPRAFMTATLDWKENLFDYPDFNEMIATYPVTWTLPTLVWNVANKAKETIWNWIKEKAKGVKTFIIRPWRKKVRQANEYPFELLFTDAQGKKVGIVGGNIMNEIEGAEVIETPEALLLRLPSNIIGNLRIKALQVVTTEMGMIEGVGGTKQEGKEGLRIVEFKPVQIEAGGTVTAEVAPEKVSDLQVDRNGDGNIDETVSPKAAEEQKFDEQEMNLSAGLALLSLPVQPFNSDPATVLGLAPEEVKLAKWSPREGKYHYYQPQTGNALAGSMEVGEGYWVKLREGVSRKFRCIKPDQSTPKAIPLKQGWNMIGIPFFGPVLWNLDGLKVKKSGEERTLEQAQQAGWIEDYAWGWEQDANNPDTGRYVLVYDTSIIPGVKGQLEPWKGYWVYAHTDCELILPPPSQGKGRGTRGEGRVAKGNGWSMRLQASVNGSVGEAVLGIANGTRGLAVGLPPEPPTGNNGVQVILLKNNTPLAVDVRSDGSRRQEWEVLVRFGTRDGGRGTSERKEVVLTFDGIGYAPKDVSAWLVDTVTGKRVYLRTQPSYRFAPEVGETERRFKVIVESGNERPLRIVGLKATPMRGEGLVITFALTKPAQVVGEVLTLTGRKIAIMDDGSTRMAGTHRMIWRGVGSEGVKVPIGAYLVRLVATDEDGRQVQAVTVVRSK